MYLMFKVFDYLTGNTFSFDDQQTLVDWWKKTNGKLNFSELNVTGCDYHGPSLDAYVNPETQEWNFAPNKEIKPQIKRFVVIDNNGRKIDIRTWPAELWDYKQRQIHLWERYPWLYSGSKRPWHKTKGMSFNHKDLKNYTKIEADELPAGIEPAKIKKISPPTDWGSFYCIDKRQMNKAHKSRSWKDQSKAAKQYMRHKKKGDPIYRPEAVDIEREKDILCEIDPDDYMEAA